MALDDAIWEQIIIYSLQNNKKKNPLYPVSRHLQKLSCLHDTLTIKDGNELKEILTSRNPSRKEDLKEGKNTGGYELPTPLRICLSFGHTHLSPHLTPEDFQSLLKKFSHLTGLSLRDNCLKGENAKVLEQYLMNTSCLKELDVKGNCLFDKECAIFSHGLSKNKTLTSLQLSVPALVDELFKTICKLPLLKFLALKGVINPAALTHLSKAIEQSSSPLQGLDLSEASLMDNNQTVITEVCNRKNIQLKWENKTLEKPPVIQYRSAGTFVGGQFVPGNIEGGMLNNNSRSRELTYHPRW